MGGGPERLIRYLTGYVGCARYGGMSGLDAALHFWEDYLTAAEATGYPLHRENVLLPKNLGEPTTRPRKSTGGAAAAEREGRAGAPAGGA